MTRQEAKEKQKHGFIQVSINYQLRLIDKIYDYFENRTCRTCIFSKLSTERYLPQHKCAVGINAVSLDFCCNRYKIKE